MTGVLLCGGTPAREELRCAGKPKSLAVSAGTSGRAFDFSRALPGLKSWPALKEVMRAGYDFGKISLVTFFLGKKVTVNPPHRRE